MVAFKEKAELEVFDAKLNHKVNCGHFLVGSIRVFPLKAINLKPSRCLVNLNIDAAAFIVVVVVILCYFHTGSSLLLIRVAFSILHPHIPEN